MARQSAHSHASRIPSFGRNGSALLVVVPPQSPSDSLLSHLSVKRLTALLRVPSGTLFYMRREEASKGLYRCFS